MLKAVARLFSYLFHPLLILTFLLLIMMNVNPYLFGNTGFTFHNLTLIQIFFSTALLPGVAIIVMERLGIVESLRMDDKQERTGPYIASGIFYLWIFVNVNNNGEIPEAYRAFVLAATIALFMSFFINIFRKINIHAVAAGVFLSAIIVMWATFEYPRINTTAILMLAILFTGLIGTTQLILGNNEPTDVYGGYLIGFVAQAIAIFFILG